MPGFIDRLFEAGRVLTGRGIPNVSLNEVTGSPIVAEDNSSEIYKVISNPPQGSSDTINVADRAAEANLSYQTSAALSSVFTKLVSDKQDYVKQFNEVKNYYLVDSLLNLIAEDSLTPDITTGEVVNISSSRDDVNELLKDFQKKFNIDQIVNDIVLELLSYGDYYLRLEVDPKQGVLGIMDDVDQDKVIALYDKGLPGRFLVKTDRSLKSVPAYSYVHFIIGKAKLRLKITDKFGKTVEEMKNLPSYVRVGRPVLYGVLSKIKELLLLEKLVPATKINQITTGSMVSVNLPATTAPEKAFGVARKIEQMLNMKQGVNDNTGELAVADIFNTAGKIKVIPSFGDKGGLNQLDIKDNRSVDDINNTIRDIREVICTSIGVPPEILFGGSGNKSELLKKYARYLRKLKSIQTSIAVGLSQLVLIHLTNLEGAPSGITKTDIDISFKNEIINIDELDKLEYSDAILSMTKNIIDVFEALRANEKLGKFVDAREAAAKIKSMLDMTSNLGSMINVDAESGPSEPEPTQTDLPDAPAPSDQVGTTDAEET